MVAITACQAQDAKAKACAIPTDK
jgi:hypothetical protein